jgi:hypothetical protein
MKKERASQRATWGCRRNLLCGVSHHGPIDSVRRTHLLLTSNTTFHRPEWAYPSPTWVPHDGDVGFEIQCISEYTDKLSASMPRCCTEAPLFDIEALFAMANRTSAVRSGYFSFSPSVVCYASLPQNLHQRHSHTAPRNKSGRRAGFIIPALESAYA